MKRFGRTWFLFLAIAASLFLGGCQDGTAFAFGAGAGQTDAVISGAENSYGGEPYAVINGNVPYFEDEDFTETAFEEYSELDSLGRCGTAFANVGRELMPTEERGSIGQVKPSGWQTVKYDIVDGKYLYNRCHLIGYQLTAENANERNLITGTRYMNVEGMLPFENMVADYIKETGNHVLYRVTPEFSGENLVADGVLMEAESVEDGGEGIQFCVFVYNVQPGIEIDYETGESRLAESAGQNGIPAKETSGAGEQEESAVLSEEADAQHQHEEIPQTGMQQRFGHEPGKPGELHREPPGAFG